MYEFDVNDTWPLDLHVSNVMKIFGVDPNESSKYCLQIDTTKQYLIPGDEDTHIENPSLKVKKNFVF